MDEWVAKYVKGVARICEAADLFICEAICVGDGQALRPSLQEAGEPPDGDIAA